MEKGLIYIHGKNGSAKEADHFKPLFPDYSVVGFDYRSETPWDAKKEFSAFFDRFSIDHSNIVIIANSIGAFFTIVSLFDKMIYKAFFISPIVDMEALIRNMMLSSGITEDELKAKLVINTTNGQRLSWDYLSWVRNHPVKWNIPTSILYGEKDELQSLDIISDFASRSCASVTLMENGEHWFHTKEQMSFLDEWIKNENV